MTTEKAKKPPAKQLLFSDLTSESTKKLRAVRIETPEFEPGSFIHVAQLSANELDEYEFAWIDYCETEKKTTNVGICAYSVAYCLCDERRNFMADTQELRAVLAKSLGSKSSSAVRRAFTTASRLNGLSKKDVEDLEKKYLEILNAQESGDGSGEWPSDSDSPAEQNGSAD